ncbi:MAG: hypothetical protein AB7U34_10020 [Novosphingobium sp.]
MMRGLSALVLLALLGACGARTDLRPQPGKELPTAPYGAEEPKTASELLEPEVQAQPERSIELRTRSEERDLDPFDLPPED